MADARTTAAAPGAPRTLAVRLDSDGDVLLTGPALRALRAGSARLDLAVSPAGTAAARLLPGIDDIIVLDAPWVGHRPAPVDVPALDDFRAAVHERAYDHVVVFTSYHQSPLPMALLARMAGVPEVSAMSEEYPGSLLDVRARRVPGHDDDGGPDGGHEVLAALRLAEEAGYPLPPGDDARLRIRPLTAADLAPVPAARPYVVVHPRASVPSRSVVASQAADITSALRSRGWHVVVTGTSDHADVGELLAAVGAEDRVGRTTLHELAGLIAGAACIVVGNTGPAHLAAAVGTPVVSLFSPVVPAERWAPWGVPHVLLGDQHAACRGSRARDCPLAGHPCLSGIPTEDVVAAVTCLTSTVLRPGTKEVLR